MENTNWLKQTEQPLFKDLLWSRPENRNLAGKLLIVGGNLHGFSAPAVAYQTALKAGIGAAKVILPSATQKAIGTSFSDAQFAPSTPVGSFSQSALAELLDASQWANSVLLAGDFGRNSETAIMLESFASKYDGQLSIAGDGIDYFLNAGSTLLQRKDSLMVINLGKLQKLAKNNRPSTPILHNMNLQELVSVLADWTNAVTTAFVTKHADNLLVAYKGRVSTTPQPTESNWQLELGAYGSVWWLQQPQKPFEAITSAVYEYVN